MPRKSSTFRSFTSLLGPKDERQQLSRFGYDVHAVERITGSGFLDCKPGLFVRLEPQEDVSAHLDSQRLFLPVAFPILEDKQGQELGEIVRRLHVLFLRAIRRPLRC